MSLLTLNKVSLSYGLQPLLDHVDFQISAGERVCLIGRNGAGKSSLFRIISGAIRPDDGEVRHRDTLRISHLEQEVPEQQGISVYDMIADGLGHIGKLLAEYRHTSGMAGSRADDAGLARLAELQQRIESMDGWNIEQRIASVLSKLTLPPEKPINHCSGGVRRRAMLGRTLVSDPDLLLLDEPTNHMDIDAITWLEDYLLGYRGALLLITHDRTLVERLATRIVELDRGVLTSFPGNYAEYLRRKEELLEIEARADAKFDRRLSEHEAWLRKGIKARRTRNEGRIRKLQAMRRERAQRRERPGTVDLRVDSGVLSGRRVVDLHRVNFHYDGRCIIRDLSTTIMRGDRIGIIGPNGSGKSTLLQLILGELRPDSGDIVHGSRLQTVYFDQNREILNPDKTVRDNISDGSDYVTVQGKTRHVIGYLKDFLFPPERIDSPVRILSGGERNRLLLARIFTRPANMMVLDEPTNDLDVDTLELLEDLLSDYDGTLLLVSHDRSFLDNIVTSTLAYEGDGRFNEYVGGYQDWLRQRKPPAAKSSMEAPAETSSDDDRPRHSPNKAGGGRGHKLGYREREELESLPVRIERLESEQRKIEAELGDGGFYRRDRKEITTTMERLETIRSELENAYARWAELDARDR